MFSPGSVIQIWVGLCEVRWKSPLIMFGENVKSHYPLTSVIHFCDTLPLHFFFRRNCIFVCLDRLVLFTPHARRRGKLAPQLAHLVTQSQQFISFTLRFVFLQQSELSGKFAPLLCEIVDLV